MKILRKWRPPLQTLGLLCLLLVGCQPSAPSPTPTLPPSPIARPACPPSQAAKELLRALLAVAPLAECQPRREALAREWAATVQPPAPTPRPPTVFGITTRLEAWENTAAMTDLGASWARASIAWNSVEPVQTKPPTYQWIYADGAVLQTLQTGAQPVMMLWENPAWAAETPCGPLRPGMLPAFARFVQAVVERYDGDGLYDAPGSPVVRVYELFNEPDWRNTEESWLGGCWGDAGAEYAALMQAGYEAAHAAWDEVILLNGAIASEDIGPNAFNFKIEGGDFVDDFLAAGGGRWLDGFNIHYYPAFGARWQPYGRGLVGKVNYYRDRLAAHGLPHDLPFYTTEGGVALGKTVGTETITPELQAAFVAQLFAEALAAEVRLLTWHTLKDEQWGLLAPDGTPRPAYHAFQTLAEALGNAQSEGRCGELPLECYAFRHPDGRRLHLAWKTAPGPVTLSLPGRRARLTAMDGTVREMVAEGGTLAIPLHRQPLLIEIDGE